MNDIENGFLEFGTIYGEDISDGGNAMGFTVPPALTSLALGLAMAKPDQVVDLHARIMDAIASWAYLHAPDATIEAIAEVDKVLGLNGDSEAVRPSTKGPQMH